jgi:alpha-ketoglutaric semialdehyde dehydrogenase
LDRFKTALGAGIANVASATMLTAGICSNYQKLAKERLGDDVVNIIGKAEKLNTENQNQALAVVSEIAAADFLADDKFKEEVFGPYSMLVVCR